MELASRCKCARTCPYERLSRAHKALISCAAILAAFSRCAVAQIDITGGTPYSMPGLMGIVRTPSLNTTPAATQTLVLEIVVNGVNLSEPSTVELRNGKLYTQPQTLTDSGIRVDDIKPDTDG
ncbi:hypothetical protein BHUM_04838 [Candidatus Burkholderia humilis]|nr:hypothetical protein BHUM_04838 [Candidatus Burkholderia humilis]